MPFTTPLRAELIDDTANEGQGEWMLLEPLAYTDNEGNEYVVPALFTSDYASVPRRPLAYLLTGGTAHRASVLHDWLIRTNACPREQADLLFREAMESVNMPGWRVAMMYNAVRAETQNLAERKEWGEFHDAS